MSIFSKYSSLLVDNVYRLVMPKKNCKLFLENDFFDGKKFTSQEFFDYTKQFFDHPELFYREGEKPLENDIKKVHYDNKDSFSCYSYPSPFKTEWQENNTAYFNLFTSKEKSDTILIFAPGWARPNLKAETGLAKKLLSKGIDTCLLIKPFHQQRTPKGFYSGELFISGNVFLTVMNFRQLVAEIQFMIEHFKLQYKYVGLIGMSSGGFQSGLALNIKEVDYYFPMITGSDLGGITWEGKLTKYVKKDIKRRGLSKADLSKIWAISDQTFLGHHCKAKHIKQFISLYDQVIPLKYQKELWNIYQTPEKLEMKCAHTSVFFYFSKIVDEISQFIVTTKK